MSSEIDIDRKLDGSVKDSQGDDRINNDKTNHTDYEEQRVENGKYNKNGTNLYDDIDEQTSFSSWVQRIEDGVHLFWTQHKTGIKRGIYISLFVVYLAYFAYCMYFRFGDEGSIILLVITICLMWKLLFVYLDSRDIKVGFPLSLYAFLESDQGRRLRKISRLLAYIAAAVGIVTYLSLSVFSQHPSNIRSFIGMLVLIAICFVFSAKPSKINWYPVFWSFVIQFVIAALTLRTQVGYDIFAWLGDLVQNLLSFSDDGAEFVVGENFKDMGLAFTAVGMIVFTNALIFILNDMGAIQFVVLKLGNFLAFCLETGPVESVIAAANIFIGLTEAPLLIRPYLPTITDSELHAIMTCGFASISGGSLAFFIQIGAPANHLLTAAVISAPAALAFSKLMYPETDRVAVENQGNIRMLDEKRKTSPLNAFSEGASMAVMISASVFSNMIAFVSMLALMDSLCVWIGERAGLEGVTFSVICSYILFPLAYAMGVEEGDCKRVGKLIGVRWLSTPVVAYAQLGDLIENRKSFEEYIESDNGTWHWEGDDVILEASNVTLVDGFIQERTEVIATYALCGFSAFTAIGIVMGNLPSICPARKQDIVRLVTRAFVAGNMACFATGAVAGVLYTPNSTMS